MLWCEGKVRLTCESNHLLLIYFTLQKFIQLLDQYSWDNRKNTEYVEDLEDNTWFVQIWLLLIFQEHDITLAAKKEIISPCVLWRGDSFLTIWKTSCFVLFVCYHLIKRSRKISGTTLCLVARGVGMLAAISRECRGLSEKFAIHCFLRRNIKHTWQYFSALKIPRTSPDNSYNHHTMSPLLPSYLWSRQFPCYTLVRQYYLQKRHSQNPSLSPF